MSYRRPDSTYGAYDGYICGTWKDCSFAMCKTWQANREACCWRGRSENSEEAKAVPPHRGGKLVMRRIEHETWLNGKSGLVESREVRAHVRAVFRRERIWGIFEEEKANDGRTDWCTHQRHDRVASH